MTVTVRPGLVAGPYELHRTEHEPRPYERLRVLPSSPTIGAEVLGVDLRDPVDDELWSELDRALLEWKVLFFRDQDLSAEQHRDFARRWGPLEVHPFLPAGDVPEVVRFDKGPEDVGYENIWHSDVSWREVPSLGSVLRCVVPAELGGDTLWADMYEAYDGLDDETKAQIDGLVAVHDFAASFGQALEPARLAEMREQYPPAHHPVVRTHPGTGRRLLYVNEIFATGIVGMEGDEARALIRTLASTARTPEYQCRFRWTAGAIAFWDNRCTQHYAVSDYFPHRRVMERATIVGDRPV
jgi:taurine dioxygenase